MANESALFHDQISQILAIANQSPRLQDLRDTVRILANTMMHQAEFWKLRWSDIETTQSRILIRADGSFSGRRFMPIGPKSLAAFESLRQRRAGSELVLGGRGCTLLRRVGVQVDAIAAVLGMPPMPLDTLRARSIKRLFDAGADYRVTCRCVGRGLPTWQKLIAEPEQDCEALGNFFAHNLEEF